MTTMTERFCRDLGCGHARHPELVPPHMRPESSSWDVERPARMALSALVNPELGDEEAVRLAVELADSAAASAAELAARSPLAGLVAAFDAERARIEASWRAR